MGIEIRKDNTDEILKLLDDRIEAALTAIGIQAANYAADNSPVDTGRLRASMTSEVRGRSAYIGTDVEYAPYQEFGTSRGVTGKHMLQNAVHSHTDEYRQMLATFLKG